MSTLQASSSAMNKSAISSSNKRQFVPLLLLSLMWTMMFSGAMARPSLGSLLTKQNDISSQLFLEDLFANANGENLYHELKKYHHKSPSYLSKWPGLRDLVLTIDYDDYFPMAMDSNEMLNNKLFERLRQLTSSNGDLFEDVREETEDLTNGPMKLSKVPVNQNQFKEHNTKKNVQYMSPCHFKICNMGRKRDARLFTNN